MRSYRNQLEKIDKERRRNDVDMKYKVRHGRDNIDWNTFEAALDLASDKMTSDSFEIYKKINGCYVRSSGVAGLVNFMPFSDISVLLLACYNGDANMVRKLLSFEELDVNYKDVVAVFVSIHLNAIECFEAFSKCDRIDWNRLDEDSDRIVLTAAYFQRVEMLQALTKVKTVNWNHQNPKEGLGVAHYAIMTLKDSCCKILDILQEIPSFNINQRNNAGDTPLCLALMKRDFKAIIKLFQFPNLELNENDFDRALQRSEDIDTMIRECFKSYKETGYNYSDVVDFLTEYKISVEPSNRNPKKQTKGRKGRNRGN